MIDARQAIEIQAWNNFLIDLEDDIDDYRNVLRVNIELLRRK